MLEGKSIAVYDLEIKKEISECSKGWQSHDEMGISCLGAFDYKTGRYRIFDESNLPEFFRITKGYLLVGFNTVNFDSKVISGTANIENWANGDFDILREIWISQGLDPDNFNMSTHGGYKLDDVAFDTIRLRKSGSGGHAPLLYKQGCIAELHDYCLEDVRIEKELFEFIVRFGYVIRNGKRIRLNIEQIREYE